MFRILGLIAILMTFLFASGCSQLTMDQAAIQQKQMANFTEFAQDNGLSLIMTATADLDGTAEFRQAVKWSPVTGSATAVFFNSQSIGMLRDLLEPIEPEGKSLP